jgi:hypothetical protein
MSVLIGIGIERNVNSSSAHIVAKICIHEELRTNLYLTLSTFQQNSDCLPSVYLNKSKIVEDPVTVAFLTYFQLILHSMKNVI